MVRARRGVGVALLALSAVALGGCTVEAGSVDGVRGESLVYLVHNEVFRIGIDGNNKESLGKVGFNRYRTGWPRLLTDGRVAVLGDEWGAIYPYVLTPESTWERRGRTNVMVTDSIGAATIAGEPRLMLTVSPFSATSGVIQTIDVDQNHATPVAAQKEGQLLNPSRYGDGQVLAVRTTVTRSTVEIFDIASPGVTSRVVATVERPWLATQPVRLPDDRIAFLRITAEDEDPLPKGIVFIVERDGSVVASQYTNVIALTVVGRYLVMEAGGGNDISDLVATDLQSPAFNITRTPYDSEHLTWSD